MLSYSFCRSLAHNSRISSSSSLQSYLCSQISVSLYTLKRLKQPWNAGAGALGSTKRQAVEDPVAFGGQGRNIVCLGPRVGVCLPQCCSMEVTFAVYRNFSDINEEEIQAFVCPHWLVLPSIVLGRGPSRLGRPFWTNPLRARARLLSDLPCVFVLRQVSEVR